ncbi:MAG: CDP-archaeol synthase [Vicinamibacteria bacterium]|nr:CDP-archaeol synthase [Vicinamibacteria bacterium]
MNASGLDPAACAVLLTLSFVLAGACQAVWLASPRSWRFSWPLDGHRTLGGRRLLGANKTARGFLVMVPATSVAFMAVGEWLTFGGRGVWAYGPVGYGVLGLVAGLGFMAGELPNSLLKRQLDIAPGTSARGAIAGPVFFVLDRVDSLVGMLVALGAVVPVPSLTVVYVLVVGPLLHGLFSVITFRLGGKARAA